VALFLFVSALLALSILIFKKTSQLKRLVYLTHYLFHYSSIKQVFHQFALNREEYGRHCNNMRNRRRRRNNLPQPYIRASHSAYVISSSSYTPNQHPFGYYDSRNFRQTIPNSSSYPAVPMLLHANAAHYQSLSECARICIHNILLEEEMKRRNLYVKPPDLPPTYDSLELPSYAQAIATIADSEEDDYCGTVESFNP